MSTADEQIRVSDRIERQLDRRRREGESNNDVLERMLSEDDADFYDGFGILSDEQGERLRERRQQDRSERRRRAASGANRTGTSGVEAYRR